MACCSHQNRIRNARNVSVQALIPTIDRLKNKLAEKDEAMHENEVVVPRQVIHMRTKVKHKTCMSADLKHVCIQLADK